MYYPTAKFHYLTVDGDDFAKIGAAAELAGAKTGDVLELSPPGMWYRNSTRYLYRGNGMAMRLDTYPDDYGTRPIEFSIERLPLYYYAVHPCGDLGWVDFNGLIDHNNYVPICSDENKQAVMEAVSTLREPGDTAKCIVNGELYGVIMGEYYEHQPVSLQDAIYVQYLPLFKDGTHLRDYPDGQIPDSQVNENCKKLCAPLRADGIPYTRIFVYG